MPNETCPVCGHRLPREFLSTHLMRAHPESRGGSPGASPVAAPPPSGAYQGDLASGLSTPDSLAGEAMPPPEEAGPTEASPPGSEEPAAPAEAASSAPEPGPDAPPLPGGTPDAGASSSEIPAAVAATATTPPSGPSGAASVPSAKELRAWLVQQRRRTDKSLRWAEAWYASAGPSRRRR